MSEEMAISEWHEWTCPGNDDDRCPECGATADEPCATGCPNEREVPFALRHTDDDAATYALDCAEMWEE